ncbi:MAG: signal peptidase I [Eggerthellaceae bacterium]|nr:signal peptidase I [Eggerthellaceae bacterium]
MNGQSLTLEIARGIEFEEDLPPDLLPEKRRPQQAVQQVSVWRDLASLAIKIAVILVAFAFIFSFIYGLHRNTDPDMAPMVKDGDVVVFYRLDKGYAIGDLVLLRYEGEIVVRRVVAQAGDVVDITKDGLVINGSLQQEPEIFQTTRRYENKISFPLTVGEGQIFVLGDARENATDSRIYGPVDTSDTLGKAITIMRWRRL